MERVFGVGIYLCLYFFPLFVAIFDILKNPQPHLLSHDTNLVRSVMSGGEKVIGHEKMIDLNSNAIGYEW